MSTVINCLPLVTEIALKYGYADEHAISVEAIGLKIFDSLFVPAEEYTLERNLLSHACLLHDIGSRISEERHHKHTKYIITEDCTLDSYPEHERKLLALIAYNHRKKIHRDVKLLSKNDMETVMKLSSILRIADSLDYSRGRVKVTQVELEKKAVKIHIEGEPPEKVKKRLDRKKTLFCKLFKLDVIF